MASFPKDGPTISDWIISAEAGVFLRGVRWLNQWSLRVNVPVISDRPPAIAPLLTPGAE